MIYTILASTPSGLIGNKNRLPWRIKEELKLFKNTTLNTTLLMGYNTYISLPKKLVDRDIIVLTRRELSDVKTIKIENIEKLLEKFKNNKEILFIAGGKQLYESFYKYSSKIYHSIIHREYEGDVYINLDYSNYNLQKSIPYKEFTLNIYKKEIKHIIL